MSTHVPARRNKQVLLIEDDWGMRTALNQLLPERFRMLTATSAAEGLDLFVRHRPEIIITDLYLRDLDGLKLIDHLRGMAGEVPIIVISVADRPGIAAAALRAGASTFIPKPFALEELERAVDHAAESLN